ncbi:MAG: hypothetical protein JXA72_12750 [Bacteroidales bacterium]|nr:hypothetical protein [Bacteroidales bacterium]
MFLRQSTISGIRLLHLLAGIFIVGLMLIVNTFPVTAQEQDTIRKRISIAEQNTVPQSDTAFVAAVIKKHSPHKAIMYSLICPGLGQVYNHKYWKLPIIYGAGGAFAYFIIYNQNKYEKFRDTYDNNKPTASDNDVFLIDGLRYRFAVLPRGRDFYRRYRDLSIAGMGAIYLLNVIDAMVDAYFFNYDISDDLSLKMEPALIQGPGLTASLGFRINLGF